MSSEQIHYPSILTADGKKIETLDAQAGFYFHDMLLALGNWEIMELISGSESVNYEYLYNVLLEKYSQKGYSNPNLVAGNHLMRSLSYLSPQILERQGKFRQDFRLTEKGQQIHDFLTDLLDRSTIPKDEVVKTFENINQRHGIRRHKNDIDEKTPIHNIRILWFFLFNDSVSSQDLRDKLNMQTRSSMSEFFTSFPTLFSHSDSADKQRAYIYTLSEKGKHFREDILLPIWRKAERTTKH